jgi:hypothetical protein
MLEGNLDEGRQVLRQLLPGRLRFMPRPATGYEISGEVGLGGLLTAIVEDGTLGMVVLRQNPVRQPVVDLSALIRRESQLDDHSPAIPSRTTPHRPIFSAIGTASTVQRFGTE